MTIGEMAVTAATAAAGRGGGGGDGDPMQPPAPDAAACVAVTPVPLPADGKVWAQPRRSADTAPRPGRDGGAAPRGRRRGWTRGRAGRSTSCGPRRAGRRAPAKRTCRQASGGEREGSAWAEPALARVRPGWAIALGIRIVRGLRRGRTVNRQDAKAPRKAGSGGIERDRGTGSCHHGLGVLASWRFMRSPKPRRPPAEPATGRLSRWCARLHDHAPELMAPPRPTGGITAAQDRVRRRAVAAALAPWQQAIAAGLAKAHAPVGARPARGAGVPEAHAPIPGAAGPAAAGRLAKPGAPVGARPARGAGVPEAPCTNSRRRRARRRRPPGETRCTSRRTPARDAGVPEAHAPIPGAAAPAAAARLAKPGAPVGARPPRDAGVPEAHAPIPGAAEPAAAGPPSYLHKRAAPRTPRIVAVSGDQIWMSPVDQFWMSFDTEAPAAAVTPKDGAAGEGSDTNSMNSLPP